MSLSIDPRYGGHQAKTANAYFTTVIQDLLEKEAGDLAPSHYMIAEHRRSSIPLRLWEDPARPRVSMEDHWHLLARVDEAVSGAESCNGSVTAMQKVIASIPHHLDSAGKAPHTFVLERLEPDDAFTSSEHADLIIGVVDELVVFIRADVFTLVRLDEGLYGCAVRGKGSYLIEVEEEAAAGRGHVHHDHR